MRLKGKLLLVILMGMLTVISMTKYSDPIIIYLHKIYDDIVWGDKIDVDRISLHIPDGWLINTKGETNALFINYKNNYLDNEYRFLSVYKLNIHEAEDIEKSLGTKIDNGGVFIYRFDVTDKYLNILCKKCEKIYFSYSRTSDMKNNYYYYDIYYKTASELYGVWSGDYLGVHNFDNFVELVNQFNIEIKDL